MVYWDLGAIEVTLLLFVVHKVWQKRYEFSIGSTPFPMPGAALVVLTIKNWYWHQFAFFTRQVAQPFIFPAVLCDVTPSNITLYLPTFVFWNLGDSRYFVRLSSLFLLEWNLGEMRWCYWSNFVNLNGTALSEDGGRVGQVFFYFVNSFNPPL